MLKQDILKEEQKILNEAKFYQKMKVKNQKQRKQIIEDLQNLDQGINVLSTENELFAQQI